MKNLRSYFTVIFDTPEISDGNLRKCTEVHLKRLSADNPGNRFTPLLTATAAAYDGYFDAIQDEATKAAIQKGRTRMSSSIFRAAEEGPGLSPEKVTFQDRSSGRESRGHAAHLNNISKYAT